MPTRVLTPGLLAGLRPVPDARELKTFDLGLYGGADVRPVTGIRDPSYGVDIPLPPALTFRCRLHRLLDYDDWSCDDARTSREWAAYADRIQLLSLRPKSTRPALKKRGFTPTSTILHFFDACSELLHRLDEWSDQQAVV